MAIAGVAALLFVVLLGCALASYRRGAPKEDETGGGAHDGPAAKRQSVAPPTDDHDLEDLSEETPHSLRGQVLLPPGTSTIGVPVLADRSTN